MRPTRANPTNFALEELLDDVHRAAVALPDFQRDFDWGEKDVQSLLVTVLTGWPIGSLLLMDGRPEYLELRGIEGGPPIPSEGALAHVVLDGQQRITSLYQALYDRGKYVYAIHLPSLGAGGVDELEESVRSFRRTTWDRRHRSVESQWRDQLLPVYSLRNASEFYEWRDAVLKAVGDEEAESVREQLTDTYKEVLSGLHRYQVPGVSLPHRIPPRAVARIFERVNRTGMPLDAFDLAVARSFTGTWNLRREFEDAREQYPLVEHYLGDDGGLPILQSIALRERRNVRESAVIDLPGDVIRERWDVAVAATVEALSFLRQVAHVSSSYFLPYKSQLVVLASLAQDEDLADHRSTLEAWYWGTVFTQSYDVASNTRSVADYRVLRGEDVETRLNYRRRNVARESLRTATRQSNGAVWRGFISVLLKQPALSLRERDATPVFNPEGAPGEVDVHTTSLFPRSMASQSPDAPPHLRALGVIVGKSAAVRKLGGGGLVDALGGGLTDGLLKEEALASQLLPLTAKYEYRMSTWEDLIELRVKLLEGQLRNLTDATFVEYEGADSG